MTINKNLSYHTILFFSSILFLLFPAALIAGPFVSELFLILISLLFLYLIIKQKDYEILNNKFVKWFLLFFLFLLVSLVQTDDFNLSLKPSLTYFRFGIFSLAIFFILKNNIKMIEYFYFFLIITLVVLMIDGYYQYFHPFGLNTLGYQLERPDRLGGLFFEELILGSYISKILPIFLTFTFLNKKFFSTKIKLLNFLSKYLILLFIILLYILIFLSGERAAFIITTFYFMLILPFLINYKKVILILALSVISFYGLLKSNENLKDRYFDQILRHTLNIHKEEKYESVPPLMIMPQHIGMFTAAIDIFKKNILIGSGVKTFRKNCKNIDEKKVLKLKKIKSNIIFCSTHPHNYYLQLLAETGLVGFSYVMIIFLILLRNYLKCLYRQIKNKVTQNKSYVCILSGLITLLWPISTTGSFFNNWICAILYLSSGIYLFILSNEKY